MSNDLHKRVERVLLETLGRSHENVAKAIVRDVLEDERKPLHSDDVWQTKLDAAERDRESISRRYKDLAQLVKVLEAERASWQPMTAVEKVMRKHDVADIHFWQEGRSYDGYTGEGYDVSITLRSGRGVYYAMTLADAAAKLPVEEDP